MTNIRKLTEDYAAAFDIRDLDKVVHHFAEDFQLTDPDIAELTPKGAVTNYIARLFAAHKALSFEAHDIIVDGDKSVIHFTLKLDQITLDGVDVISWKSGKMTCMQAYLTQRT